MRKAIETYQPELAAQGTSTSTRAWTAIGTTTCVNAGEARNGKYAAIHVEPGDIRVDFSLDKPVLSSIRDQCWNARGSSLALSRARVDAKADGEWDEHEEFHASNR